MMYKPHFRRLRDITLTSFTTLDMVLRQRLCFFGKVNMDYLGLHLIAALALLLTSVVITSRLAVDQQKGITMDDGFVNKAVFMGSDSVEKNIAESSCSQRLVSSSQVNVIE
ncbi:unnamed protein product [Lepeophtheirus salmonis]|uniref:(salmon louse) hypothetical protein n=1 Tax=Lepeophtheirus salmonis TaxID=72036 RepID=A0A7R8H191_LEPSM|nr:unnamed protein product [Lepeophtheirus salmonis]CAF2790388.1 unnamed protein product [Lepeophtheirus salmonis]